MSIRKKFSIFLSLLLGFTPLPTLAASAVQITPEQVPEIKSLQNLNSLQIEGQSLEKGRDYDVDVQISADQSRSFLCFTFQNGYSGQVIKEHDLGAVDGFQDVPENYYALDSINYCADMGWIKGRDDGGFYPKDTLSRGELVTILYRLSGQPTEEIHEHFSDLDPSKPNFYTWPALWAAKHGIIKGYSDKYGHVNFKGDNPVTREELAVILHRYQGEDPSSKTLNNFSDVSKVGAPYLKAMKWAVENGIISGTDGKLNPKGNASRAQAATMLERFNKAKFQDFPAISSVMEKIQTQSHDLLFLNKTSSQLLSDSDQEDSLTGILIEPEQEDRDSLNESTENSSDRNEEDSDLNVSEEPTQPGVLYGWDKDHDQFISFETGTPQTGWLHLNGSTYYFDSQGHAVKNSYETINNKVYNLNEEGKVSPGFVELNNKSYYFSQYDGHRLEGKKYYDTKEYRLFTNIDEEGTLKELNGHTVCEFSDGSHVFNEEVKIAGDYYYFDPNGYAAKNALIKLNGQNYYYGADGKKVIGQAVKSGNGTSYFDFLDGKQVDINEWTAQQEAKAVISQEGEDLYHLFMWVVQNLTFTSEVSHQLSNGEYGRMAFENHRGNCYVFTAAFYYFAYLLGYNPIYIRGEVMYDYANKLWGDHSWMAIRDENGKLWYYDPDSERNLGHIVSFWKVDPYNLPVNLRADPALLP